MNKTDDSGKFFAEIALAASIIAVFLVVVCYSAIVSSSSWSSFCTTVGNGLSSAWNSLTNGASSLWNWSVKKLKALLSALKDYLTVVQAASKIATNVKRNSKTRYWSATLRKNYVDLGRKLTYSQAVNEVKKGKSVFTVTSAEAKAVAKAAGNNKKPIQHPKHKNTIGYYPHYHPYKHSNGAHIWYLF